jgi:hypothetical protein
MNFVKRPVDNTINNRKLYGSLLCLQREEKMMRTEIRQNWSCSSGANSLALLSASALSPLAISAASFSHAGHHKHHSKRTKR